MFLEGVKKYSHPKEKRVMGIQKRGKKGL